MTEPRRVLIDWDYGAHGIWWVLTRQELQARGPHGRPGSTAPAAQPAQAMPWRDRLSGALLDDLQRWNDACANGAADRRLLERGRDLAIRVQDELGADGWEVLYILDGQVRRVSPPGNWPVGSWRQQLLGYPPREPPPGEARP